jgi:hypothetical protein
LTECHLLTQQQLSNKTDGSSVIKREKGGRGSREVRKLSRDRRDGGNKHNKIGPRKL